MEYGTLMSKDKEDVLLIR